MSKYSTPLVSALLCLIILGCKDLQKTTQYPPINEVVTSVHIRPSNIYNQKTGKNIAPPEVRVTKGTSKQKIIDEINAQLTQPWRSFEGKSIQNCSISVNGTSSNTIVHLEAAFEKNNMYLEFDQPTTHGGHSRLTLSSHAPLLRYYCGVQSS